MRRYGEWSKSHVARLCLEVLSGDAGGLHVVDDVVEKLAEDGERGPGRVGVDLDVCVFCRGWIEALFGWEGEGRFLEGFWTRDVSAGLSVE